MKHRVAQECCGSLLREGTACSPGIHLSFANMFSGNVSACCDVYQDSYSTAACSRCMNECTTEECCLVLRHISGVDSIPRSHTPEGNFCAFLLRWLVAQVGMLRWLAVPDQPWS